jgi:hypothetical protein
MSKQRFDKAGALAHWRSLPEGVPIKAHAIAYKATGSTYGHDGIRIEGSREFIDSVLANRDPGIAAANAALIAAAPDLLAVLQDVVQASDASDGDSLANAIQAAGAAIRKATGAA